MQLHGYCASSLFLPGPPDTMPWQKLLNCVKKRSKMSSKIHPGSLQATLLATPVSTISNFCKFVQFWVFPGVPKALKLSPDGSPKSPKLSKNCSQKPLQRKLPGTLSLKTPFKHNLQRIWKVPPRENNAIYCTGAIFSHPWSRASFVNFCSPKGWTWGLF